MEQPKDKTSSKNNKGIKELENALDQQLQKYNQSVAQNKKL